MSSQGEDAPISDSSGDDLSSQGGADDLSFDATPVDTTSGVYLEGGSHQQASQTSDTPVDGELQDEVMIAHPPKEREGSDYHTIALSGSSALDILDQLVASNAIGKERAARLRRKYDTLRETLESSRQLESTLLDKVKTLGHQLNYQKKVLDKGAAFPEGDSSESVSLRQTQLAQQNELDMVNTRVSVLEQDIEQLESDRAAMDKEYDRQPKKEELDQHIKEIGKALDELKDELSMRSEDVQRCQHEVDKKNARIASINQETEEMRSVQEMLQQELINLCTGPNLPKEIEATKRYHHETLDKISEMERRLNELTSHLSEAQKRNEEMKNKYELMSFDLKEKRNLQMEQEVSLERWNKDIMMNKEREATLLEDKATLDIRQKHRQAEYKSLFIAQSTKIKEKDRELKSLKKAELQLSALKQAKQQVSLQMSLLEEKRKEMQQEYDKLTASKEEVMKDVTGLRKDMKMRNGMKEADQVKLDSMIASEGHAKNISKQLQERVQTLSKDVLVMTKERDHETALYFRAMKDYSAIRDDLRTKLILMGDQQKRIKQIDKELKDFATAYAVVKGERNRTHTQIFLMQQVHAELTEKNKILTNETEILRNTSNEKDKILQKCSVVYNAKVAERDAQRQELSGVRMSQAELSDSLDQQRAIICKLVHDITQTEEDLTRLRKQYQKFVQDRNDLGLQLIERNEEVSVFYEKVNTQESIIRKADLQLQARNEELKILNLELRMLKNDIFIFRKNLPDNEKLEVELQSATRELKMCEEEMRALESAVEDSSDPNRLRILPGEDPTCSELDMKLNKVKVQLSLCERQHLEKELLLEQVCKLTERANRKVETRRSSTLAVAKKVNHYQSRIKETTKKMMALVSELSMQQALSLRLAQEVSERETRVKQATMRIENGEVPDEEIHAEWEKLMQVERRREEAQMEREKLEKDDNSRMLPGGTITTAEPRPNAYIPSEKEDLPLPRPYGSCAPFKPTLPGGAIRHIRKPQPQPIDI